MSTEVADKETKKEVKCRITLVTPGSSDRVIDVFPAGVEKEKIWLDNTRGIERWEAVERYLNQFALRGTRVPKPMPWHSDPKQMLKPDLEEKDIPLVQLEAPLPPPPVEEKIDYTRFMNKTPQDQSNRINSLEGMVQSLATAVSNLTSELQQQKKENLAKVENPITVDAPKRGRPKRTPEAQ